MTTKTTTFTLHVGKERNMTFPKDLADKLGLGPEELVGATLVISIKKIVTSLGQVIENEELDGLLIKK